MHFVVQKTQYLIRTQAKPQNRQATSCQIASLQLQQRELRSWAFEVSAFCNLPSDKKHRALTKKKPAMRLPGKHCPLFALSSVFRISGDDSPMSASRLRTIFGNEGELQPAVAVSGWGKIQAR
jgi:hypothetical protein